MSPEWIANLVDKGIMFGAGALITYLGFFNAKPAFERYRTFFKLGGPFLMIVALALFLCDAPWK